MLSVVDMILNLGLVMTKLYKYRNITESREYYTQHYAYQRGYESNFKVLKRNHSNNIATKPTPG